MASPTGWTQTTLRHALLAKGLKPRKGYGQHFLVAPNLCRAIVEAGALPPAADVLEIGCGPGLLTTHLAPAAGRLLAVDIDPDLAALCREAVAGTANVEIRVGDILDADGRIDVAWDGARGTPDATRSPLPAARFSPNAPLYVYGNLPYNRSVEILVALLAWDRPLAQIVVLVQREVADRMLARPRGEMYGPLSVIAQAFAEVRLLRTIPPDVFWPPPRVESALVRLVPRHEMAGDVRRAWEGVRGLFQGRRKRLTNALKAMGLKGEEVRRVQKESDISDQARAEELRPEALVRLALLLTPFR